jgi:hypothetical protein
MPGITADRDQAAERPLPSPQKKSPISAAALMKSFAALILAVIGLALFLIAALVYPSTAQVSSPAYPQLAIYTNARLNVINYQVVQRRRLAEVLVTVEPYGTLPRGVARASVALIPPTGTLFIGCPRSDCLDGIWATRLKLFSDQFATAKFQVRARSFGVSYNGATAATVIPQVFLLGHENNLIGFDVHYHLPSAGKYDWSSDPLAADIHSTAEWNETVSHGETPGRAVIGINHAAQANDDKRTFIAGALFGTGGAALVGAVIEALHVRDWEVLRALRSKEQAAVTGISALDRGSVGGTRNPAPP